MTTQQLAKYEKSPKRLLQDACAAAAVRCGLSNAAHLFLTWLTIRAYQHDDGWAASISTRHLAKQLGISLGHATWVKQDLVASQIVSFRAAPGGRRPLWIITPESARPAERANRHKARAPSSASARPAEREARAPSSASARPAEREHPPHLSIEITKRDKTSSSSSEAEKNPEGGAVMVMMMEGKPGGGERPPLTPERIAFLSYIATTKGAERFDESDALQFSTLLTIEQLGWALHQKKWRDADKPERALYAILRNIRDDKLNDGERESLAMFSLRRKETNAWLQFTREGNEFSRTQFAIMLDRERGDVERAKLAVIKAAREGGVA